MKPINLPQSRRRRYVGRTDRPRQWNTTFDGISPEKNDSERILFHLVRRRRYITACMTVYTQTSAAAAAAERSALAAARVGRNQYRHRASHYNSSLSTTAASARDSCAETASSLSSSAQARVHLPFHSVAISGTRVHNWSMGRMCQHLDGSRGHGPLT